MRRTTAAVLSFISITVVGVALLLTSAQARVAPAGALASGTVPAPVHITTAQGRPFTRSVWRKQIQRLALPGRGCFTGTYPSLDWQRVACATAPNVPFAPSARSLTATVSGSGAPSSSRATSGVAAPHMIGDTGGDYVAQVTSGSISSATGTFPYVSPGAIELGYNYIRHQALPNTFTLQLNTEPFSGSPACAHALSASDCQAWQQFVYSSSYGGVFIQYWLLNYAWSYSQSYSKSTALSCPPGWISDVTQWTSSYVEDCYKNSNAVLISGSLPTMANLENLSLTGTAQASGNDSLVMLYGAGKVIGLSAADSMLDLSGSWSAAEFAILGDGDDTQADFNSATVLDVKTSVNNGASTAPTCVPESFTGETNNLGFTNLSGLAPGGEPAIETRQAVGGTYAACAAAPQSSVTITNPGTRTATVGTPVRLQLHGADGSSGQRLSWTATNLPAGLSMSAAGLITGTPRTAQSITSTVTATDSTGANDTVTVGWQVKPKPVPRKLKVALTISGHKLLLKITTGTGPRKPLQCSLVRLSTGGRAPADRWFTCWPSTEYKNLPSARYRLRVRGTGGEVTRNVTIR